MLTNPWLSSARQAGQSTNRKYHSYLQKIKYGDFSVYVHKRKRVSQLHADPGQDDDNSPTEIFQGRVVYQDKQKVISVTFRQEKIEKYTSTFFNNTIPRLYFSRILPEGHEIFTIIENGDLNGLTRILDARTVSLNDRDIVGRCLLSVRIAVYTPVTRRKR